MEVQQWVDLERVLVRTDVEPDAAWLHARWLTPGTAFQWSDILSSPCSVVLGEAGSGKTAELTAQAARLASQGKASFGLEVAAVAQRGLVDLDPDAVANWRAGAGDAWFFLDSVDEAKLRGETLRDALAQFTTALRGVLHRCRLVVSCRHSDWRAEDSQRIQRLAPLLAPVRLAETATPTTATPRRGHFRRRQPAIPAPPGPAVGIYRLAPLTREQILVYAERCERLVDAAEFVDAIGGADLWELASRPLDVAFLASAWRRRRGFGSLRSVIEDSIGEKLIERGDRAAARIAPRAARGGAERLALALTMTGQAAISIPGQNAPAGEDVVDAMAILADHIPNDVESLLRLPIFDPATLGRVRFHHRAVREYLAACCLAKLREVSLTPLQLDRFLFATVEGRTLARPGLEPVVSWLALDDPEVRTRAIEWSPEHLLDTGDPASLPLEARRRVIPSYARKYAGRRRTMHNFDRAGLVRFGGNEMADIVARHLAPGHPDDLRLALLEIVEHKPLPDCASAAFSVVQEDGLPEFLRAQAVRAVAAAGSPRLRRELASYVVETCAAQRYSAEAALETLFPDVLTAEEVLQLIRSVPRRANHVDGYTGALQQVASSCSPAVGVALLAGLTQLLEHAAAGAPAQRESRVEWLPLYAYLIEEALRRDPASEQAASALSGFVERARAVGYDRSELDRVLQDLPSVRRQLFWTAVEATRKAGGRWPRDATRVWTYQLCTPGPEDADWLQADAAHHPHPAARVIAFTGLLSVLGNDRSSRVEALAAQHPALARRLRHMRNPQYPELSPTLARLHLSGRVRDAKEAAAQGRLAERIRGNIDAIRTAKDTRDLDHLWMLGHQNLTRDDWSSAAIVEAYGDEVAEAALLGYRAFWASHRPMARHEGQSNHGVRLGRLGLDLEIAAGLDPSSLPEEKVAHAATYAAWSLNHFPDWLDACAQRRPGAVANALCPSLDLDVSSEFGERVLAKLSSATLAVRELCAAYLLDLLRVGEPVARNVLERCMEVLQGVTSVAPELRTFLGERCATSISAPERLAVWWRAWCELDAQNAVAFLRDQVSRPLGRDADAAIVACLGRRHWDRKDELPFAVEELICVAELMLTHVRPSEDVDSLNGDRSDAQDARGQYLNALSRTGELAAVRALDRLAGMPWGSEFYKDRLTRDADDCAARSAASSWSVRDALRFLNEGLLVPRNAHELFVVTVDTLEDIRHEIERGDCSIRAAYSDRSNELSETDFQILFLKELRSRARQRYDAHREGELADGTRPDIRTSLLGVGTVSIEIKVAENFSLPTLEATLPDQLVAKYLRDPSVRHGVLLLLSAKEPRRWSLPGGLGNFADAVRHLSRVAADMAAARADIEALTVVGIDFHEPVRSSDEEAQSGEL